MDSKARAVWDELKCRQADVRRALPGVMRGFSEMMQAAEKEGALPRKVKELVTLGISIAVRCDSCIALHVADCLKEGATREEVMEVCGVAIAMGGAPVYTYCSMVLDALDAFEPELRTRRRIEEPVNA